MINDTSEFVGCKVGEVARSVSETHNFAKPQLIFLNTSDILHGDILHARYSDVSAMPGQAKKSIMRDDILFSEIRPANGRWALIDRDADDYVVSTKLMVIRCDTSRVLPSYLYAFLTSSTISSRLQQIAESRSGTFPQITFDEVSRLALPLPPLDEQRRIAAVLGALDDLIEVNRGLMRDLDDLGMALFLAAWDKESWVSIESLGQVTMGQSPPGSTYNEDGRGTVFYQGVRDFGDRYPSARVYCTAPTRLADAGDILVAVRAPIGETNVAVEKTAIGRGLASLKAQHPALALRALRASARTWAAHEGTGTVFSSISGPDLRRAQVPAVLDAALESRLAALDEMHRALADEMSDLQSTRDELLPLLMSGRVRVGDVAA